MRKQIQDCLQDLEHYATTHGPGPDVRLAALKQAMAPTAAVAEHIPMVDRTKIGCSGGGRRAFMFDGLPCVIRAVRTGEYRRPLKGEWYLSGARAEAYRARADLSTEYHILRLVPVRKINEWEVLS